MVLKILGTTAVKEAPFITSGIEMKYQLQFYMYFNTSGTGLLPIHMQNISVLCRINSRYEHWYHYVFRC